MKVDKMDGLLASASRGTARDPGTAQIGLHRDHRRRQKCAKTIRTEVCAVDLPEDSPNTKMAKDCKAVF